MENDIHRLHSFFESCPNKQPFSWLNGRSFSEKFMICLGAGPWKFNRRKTIQNNALQFLNGRDISTLSQNTNIYPLTWQNSFLQNIINFCISNKIKFNAFCQLNLLVKHGRHQLYTIAGSQGSKCLSLFCRDGLQIDSFPIDRHVKRKLIELDLPTNEEKMIELCNKAGLNPNEVAVAFVRAASDMDNPDWSIV